MRVIQVFAQKLKILDFYISIVLACIGLYYRLVYIEILYMYSYWHSIAAYPNCIFYARLNFD